MSTVNQLLAEFRSSGGTAKGNRYRVSFIDSDASKLNILCDSISWPGRQVATSDYSTYMRPYRRPYSFINEDITANFILTNDWYTWNYLKNWQSSIINKIDEAVGAYTINLKSDYARDILIEHLNEKNQVMRAITAYAAFPITLNSMELSNASENTVLRCNAVFAYDNWAPTGVTNNATTSSNSSNAVTDFALTAIV
jgi:hypothetical protein